MPQRFYLVSLAEYHTFSPNVTNELRMAFNRFSQFYTVPGNLNFPGLDVFPNITVRQRPGAAGSGPIRTLRSTAIQNTYQLVDNINWTKGKHTLKFGFDGRNVDFAAALHSARTRRLRLQHPGAVPADQVPDDFAERNLGSTSYYGNQWATYLYVNDNWRVTNNLTLNLGVRYERTTVPTGQQLQALEFAGQCSGPDQFPCAEDVQQELRSAHRHRVFAGQERTHFDPRRLRYGLRRDLRQRRQHGVSAAVERHLRCQPGWQLGDPKGIFKDAPFLGNGGIFPGSLPGGGNLSVTDARLSTSSYIPTRCSLTRSNGTSECSTSSTTTTPWKPATSAREGYHLLTQNQLNKQNKVDATHFLPTYLSAPSQAELNGSVHHAGPASGALEVRARLCRRRLQR